MYHGHYAAMNIHQKMLKERHSVTPKFVEIQKAAPMICLAIGKSAAGYNDFQGVISGKDVLDLYFREDLGFESMSHLSAFYCAQSASANFSPV